MIADYLANVERVLASFPNIRSYSLRTKVYNATQGYIGGSIRFENGHSLDFVEVKDANVASKLRYRYHYMDKAQALIFRYDNAPHHRGLSTFPHHKHTPGEVRASSEPDLYAILLEIAEQERQG